MRNPPRGLTDPVWLHWIELAPAVDADERSDLYHGIAKAWLGAAPKSPVFPPGESALMRQWINEYLSAIQAEIAARPKLKTQELEKASWATIGGLLSFGAGKTLITIGAIAFNPIAAGLAGVGIGYAVISVYRDSFKVRRANMLEEIARGLAAIRDRL